MTINKKQSNLILDLIRKVRKNDNKINYDTLGEDFYKSFNTRYTGYELSSTVATTGNAGELWNSIKGNVKGVGDYFWIKLNNTNVRCRVAGRNIYRHRDSALTTNHYVIVTDTPFQKAQMNSANTTGVSSSNASDRAAFLGSDMWNLTLGANPSTGAAVTTAGINQTLYSIFGNSLLKYIDLSTNSINETAMSAAGAGWTGSTNGCRWHDCYATLLNECELFGIPVFSSSGYDIGIKNAQLPLFTLNPDLITLRDSNGNRMWYWLKNVANSYLFCAYSGYGNIFEIGASDFGDLRIEFQLSA